MAGLGGMDEGPVTRLRKECKLLVTAEEAELLAIKLCRDLCGVAPAPSWITSVYYDRADQPLALRALRTPEDCLKIRTKEYFPDKGAPGADRVVVEMKRERNGLTRKNRVWLPRSELAQALAQSPVGRKLRRLAGGPLVPTLAVTYERQVYQRAEAWRVTMDRDVRFFRVNEAQALGPTRLSPRELGEPFARELRVVVEVKHLGSALPGWLVEFARAHESRYSKFAHGIARASTEQLGDGVYGG